MRRKNIQGDSLELFLDTICNTFGGILFIALLVIILLQISGKNQLESTPQDTVDEMEYIQVQNEYEQLKEEWEHLSKQIRKIEEMNHKFTQDSLKNEFEKMKKLQKNFKIGMQEKEDLLKKSIKASKETGMISQALDALNKQCRDEEKVKKKKEKILNKEEDKKVRKRTLPQMRPTSKREIAVILRFNRFYLWHRYNKYGTNIGLNTDDFLVLSEDKKIRETLPNITKGIPLDQGDPSPAIKRKLESFSPQNYKLSFLIWPDSYDSWKTVQNAVGNLGFDYTPIPTYNGCLWVDRGGKNRDVQ
ncbi:MAG: hypothetical protein Q4G69_03765 [Planctomycetia bacterium]|nr:hypothetical protein [Planctomycetia bacterium]